MEADRLSKLANDDVTRSAALDYLYGIYPAYHESAVRWNDWFYDGNHPFMPPYMLKRQYDPEKNIGDMVKSEVSDLSKQLGYIKSLEARLKGKNPEKDNTEDFEMLSRMKKDLGQEVGFKTATEKREEERSASAGWEWNKNGTGQPMREVKAKK